ncbi:uncharacterized protein LOC128728907 [Anopheles nili]|uniref:uncharacterized protein LOC128728907 n=1 Tax=Anopheles nili TaxID=185578 RepID=UPI00237A8390|nr:uncharacterized protein LOC128728907 [Anopheles nili]
MLCARFKIILCLIQLLALKVPHSVLGLESVHIQVPVAVLVGTSATLVCECDLPDEDLYSVKWYKGKHEFFRYTSKEIPSIKIFPKAGISVNVNLSNASHLVLVNLEPQSGGKYSCEITEAAPSFHTKIATRTMNVVEVPVGEPQLLDLKPYYGAEEFLEVECRAGPSLPAARLEWLLNDQPLRQPVGAPSRLEYFTQPPANPTPGGLKAQGVRKKQSTMSSPQPQPGPPTAPTEPESRENDLTESEPPVGTPASPPARESPTTNGTGEHRKGAGGGRYELAVSRLKLLLEHGHFRNGKLKVECIAHVFDLYRRSVAATVDENYPQVRVLSNSDNGVHFSFMSDKDEASSSADRSFTQRSLLPHLVGSVVAWLLAYLGGISRGIAAGDSLAIADTGQVTRGLTSDAVLAGVSCFVFFAALHSYRTAVRYCP